MRNFAVSARTLKELRRLTSSGHQFCRCSKRPQLDIFAVSLKARGQKLRAFFVYRDGLPSGRKSSDIFPHKGAKANGLRAGRLQLTRFAQHAFCPSAEFGPSAEPVEFLDR